MKEINHPNLVNLIEFNEAMPYLVIHFYILSKRKKMVRKIQESASS
jgi:hypothetical protein